MAGSTRRAETVGRAVASVRARAALRGGVGRVARRGVDRRDRRRRRGCVRRTAVAVASAGRRGLRLLGHLPRRRGDGLGARRARLDRLGGRRCLVHRRVSGPAAPRRAAHRDELPLWGIGDRSRRLPADPRCGSRRPRLRARRRRPRLRGERGDVRDAWVDARRRGDARVDGRAALGRGLARGGGTRRGRPRCRRPLDGTHRRTRRPLPRPGARLRRERARFRRSRTGRSSPISSRTSSARTASRTGFQTWDHGQTRCACSGATGRPGSWRRSATCSISRTRSPAAS